jgi:thiol-disulfide isomerase/thioredoxin
MLLGCKNNSNKNGHTKNIIIKKDSINLVNKLPKNKSLDLYNIGIFEKDIFPIAFNANDSSKKIIKTDRQIYLLSANLEIAFIINPGEKISVSSDDENRPLLSIENNQERTNELSLFYDLDKNIHRPPEALGMLRPGRTHTKKDFINCDSVLTKWLKNSNTFIENKISSKKINPFYGKLCEKYIYYERTSKILASIVGNPEARKLLVGTEYQKFKECDDCIAMPNYRIALYYYIKINSSKNKLTKPLVSDFEFAKQNFNGDTKKNILYSLLFFNMDKSFEAGEYSERLNYFLKTYPNDTLSNFLKRNYDLKLQAVQLTKGNQKNDEALINQNGKLVKWSDILLQNKGKVILVDFWANYCAPCIYQIPYSQKLAHSFEKKDISFIYISFDGSKATWLQALEEHNLKNENNYFRINKAANSGISAYFKIKQIPTYIIYDKQGHLANIDAPRPDDPKLKDILLKLTKN